MKTLTLMMTAAGALLFPAFAAAATYTQTAFSGNCSVGQAPPTETVTREIVERFGSAYPAGLPTNLPISVHLETVNGSTSGNCYANSAALATIGALGVRGNAGTNRRGIVTQIGSTAHLSAAEIYLVPALGFSRRELERLYGQNVTISPNLVLDGSVTSDFPTAFSTISGSVSMQGRNAAGGLSFASDDTIVSNSPSGIGGPSYEFGFFTREIGEDISLQIDPAQPFSIEMTLSGSARASNAGRFFGNTDYEAMNSLTFATEGPAFDVPEGYTIFSSQLNIFDNIWVDPRVQVSPSPVPLPASAWFLIAACAGLFARKPHRTRDLA